MFHWFGVVQNTRGDSLPGWQVGLVDLNGMNVMIFADENSTPIQTVSGIPNRAVADDFGNYDFFVPSGTYTLQFFNREGEFQRAQRFVAMFGADAANTANLASNDAGKGASLVATEGSGTVQAALNARPTSATLAASGGAALVGFTQSGTGAVPRTVQDKLREAVSVKDFGAVGNNVADDSAEIQLTADTGLSFTFPPGTYKSDVAVTGELRSVSFGAQFTGTNAFDSLYPNFGPGALKVIARGTFNNSIIGIAHNTAPPATTTFPTGITGYGRNDNAGNQVFGVYAEARQHATSGVACNEIDSFNMTATAPSSNLPPALGIGTAENHPIALQVGAGGTANSSIGIHICQEGSSPQKFLTGIYMNHAALVNYGLFIDAVAGSTFVPAVIKHGAGQVAVQLSGVGTPAPNNAVLVYTDGAAVERFSIRQDGRLGFSAAITQSTVGVAGAASVLPTNPTGYLKVLIGGSVKAIPYYEAA